MKNTPNIAVLAGGVSSERTVSLRSGESVLKALTDSGYQADLLDIQSATLAPTMIEGFDVAFSVLHGTGGEDGTMQAQLDAMGVRYVGSNEAASRLCFDKSLYRQLLGAHQMPVAAGEVVTAETIWSSPLLTKPFVLKPVTGGSSIDTLIVRNPSSINRDNIAEICSRHDKMLLEQLIEGVEITVGVLGNQALPIIEIIPPTDGEFDYENKYNGATQEICPATHVPADVQSQAQQLAVQLHQLTGCRHYSRTDMIVQTDGSLIVLETNTLPGMTDQSLFPKAASAAGYTMPKLVDCLVQMAISDRTAVA